jgi:hypothetical protein
MSTPDDNLKALTAFAAAADDFCRFVEGLPATRPERLYTTLESLLARLHCAILPVEQETPEKDHPEYDKLRPTSDVFSGRYAVLTAVFAEECAALVKWHKSFEDSKESACDAERCISGR